MTDRKVPPSVMAEIDAYREAVAAAAQIDARQRHYREEEAARAALLAAIADAIEAARMKGYDAGYDIGKGHGVCHDPR